MFIFVQIFLHPSDSFKYFFTRHIVAKEHLLTLNMYLACEQANSDSSHEKNSDVLVEWGRKTLN